MDVRSKGSLKCNEHNMSGSTPAIVAELAAADILPGAFSCYLPLWSSCCHKLDCCELAACLAAGSTFAELSAVCAVGLSSCTPRQLPGCLQQGVNGCTRWLWCIQPHLHRFTCLKHLSWHMYQDGQALQAWDTMLLFEPATSTNPKNMPS